MAEKPGSGQLLTWSIESPIQIEWWANYQ